MWGILAAMVVIAILWGVAGQYIKPQKSNENVPVTVERTLPVMGTISQYKLYGDKKTVEKASDKVRDVFFEVQNTCNIFDQNSELSQLNRTAAEKPFKCSLLLWEILMQSKRAYELSDGAFDITARPLMQLWGFYRKRGDALPSPEEIAATMKTVGMDKVVFDQQAKTVKFKVTGVSFDLGGIAKGFAVDRAADAVKELGIKQGIINLAGNIYCFPEPLPSRLNYKIGIKDPFNKEAICGHVNLLNESIATSGNYERYVTIKGKRYTHIMDIRTGKPVSHMLSVTIITPSATDADFLSTSVFINGPEFAEKIIKKIPQTEILIIRESESDKPEIIQFGNKWKIYQK
jgi:thiamine biosynthesis lipoprotein